MRRLLMMALCVAVLCAWGGRASATICSGDVVPSASLLLPFFQVGNNDNGTTGANPNTIITVGNASATAVLLHMNVYSDLSAHVLNLNFYLTGYDVLNINLGDLLQRGFVPRTASAGQDPQDNISPKGQFSQDINFASCNGILPQPDLESTNGNLLPHVQAALTGQQDPIDGRCRGQNFGDNIMRGYVTIDAVNQCNLEGPGDVGPSGPYFAAGGTGIATNQNVLWGTVAYLNSVTDKAFGEPLVNIEASATDPATSTSGRYTFYGRYDNFTAVDNREPLATTFVPRYYLGTGVTGKRYFTQGSSLIVWRDSKKFTNTALATDGSFTCGTAPSWYPMGQEGITIFDDQEHPALPAICTVSPCPPNIGLMPFPAEAQKVVVGSTGKFGLPVPFGQGFIYLDLNMTLTGNSVPPVDPAAAQAYVSTWWDNATPSYRSGARATQLDSACAANHFFPH